tara:strand:- start:338 stop:481 length:144 start_codon:yes stop_codon:yes gene_type:complete
VQVKEVLEAIKQKLLQFEAVIDRLQSALDAVRGVVESAKNVRFPSIP